MVTQEALIMETQTATIPFEPAQSKSALWQQRIAAWHNSGLSQKAWCQREQVPLSSLGYWRKKLHGPARRNSTTESGQRFIPVALTRSSAAMTLRVGNTLSIEVAPDIERSLLKDLLGWLREAP